MDWRDEWKAREIPEEAWPIEHPNTVARVKRAHRRTAYENKPGLSKFYVDVFDDVGNPVGGVNVRFDTEPSEGTAYDHPNVYGLTGGRKGNLGHIEYEHPRIPTRYMIYVGGELVLSNVRLDLGNEYPVPPGSSIPTSWIPVNRNGVYSYDLEFELL